jgi:hypothetical protein
MTSRVPAFLAILHRLARTIPDRPAASTAAVPTNPDPWPRRMQITGGT